MPSGMDSRIPPMMTGSRNGKKGTEEMSRTNLKILRIKQGLNQKLFAEKIGVTRTYYGLIESGKVDGSVSFWKSLQNAFCVSDAEMWELMKNEA